MSGELMIVGWGMGFTLTIVSLAYGVHHFRITRAMSYIERMNSSDMVHIRAEINAWLDRSGSDIEKFEELRRDSELDVKLKIFMDIITELGVAYRYRSVSRKLVREIWYPFIPEYWKRLQFFAYACQARGVRTGYWFRYLAEEIASDMARREKTLVERYRLPERYFSATAGDWVPVAALAVEEAGASPAADAAGGR